MCESRIEELREERARQEAKFPNQVLPATPAQIWPHMNPLRSARDLETPSESRAKQICDKAAADGSLTRMYILSEEHSEVAEAGALGDAVAMRAELPPVDGRLRPHDHGDRCGPHGFSG